MKKILFIAPIDTKDRFKGGITSYAESIIEHEELFNNSEISFIPFNNCLVNRKSGTNGKLSILNFVNFVKTRHLISKTLKQGTYDAIYLNTSFGISLLKDLLTLKKKYKKKYQVFLHIHFADFDSIFTKRGIIKRTILSNLRKKVTNIISLSTNLKEKLVSIGFSEYKIDVLYNYFNPNLAETTTNDIENKYSKRKECFTFLFVGSLDKRKGFYDLINAFNQIEQKNVRLIICGKPNDENSEKAIEEIKDKSVFDYRGYVSGEAKNKAFLDSDVFILPSYGEGLPITILEAFHFGMPVISTNVGAIPEIIDDSNGRIVNPGDLKGIKNAILQLCNEELLLKLGLNCLNHSKSFTFNYFANNLINIINK